MKKAVSFRTVQVRRISLQAIGFAVVFAFFFSAIGIAEHQFSKDQINAGIADDLRATIDDVEENLLENRKWRIEWYRQWDNVSEPSNYLILTGTGELVDLTGDGSALIRSTLPIDRYTPKLPTEVKSDLAETWLIENRRISGGNVVGAIAGTDLPTLNNPKRLLENELKKFGSRIKAAGDVDTTIIKNYITGAAVVDDDGRILNMNGSLPIRVGLVPGESLLDGNMHRVNLSGRDYAIIARRITSVSPIAIIVAYDFYSTEAIDASLKFSIYVSSLAWITALLAYGLLRVRSRVKEVALDTRLEISTRQLIAQGENAPVEFKETLRRNVATKEFDKKMEFSVLKTIGAFLNTEGGTLLVGVSDSGEVKGLAADGFHNNDKAMLHLSNLISTRIGSAHMARIKIRIDSLDNVDVMRVDCKVGKEPAYVRTENGQSFFVRAGPSTRELPLDEVHSYIKSHFDEG